MANNLLLLNLYGKALLAEAEFSSAGTREYLPINFVLNNLTYSNDHPREDCKISLDQHFRVWFSKDPDIFMPPFERTILEESIRNNLARGITTTLVIDWNFLSDKARVDLTAWAEKHSCIIKDYKEVASATKEDQVICEIISQELYFWRNPPYLGNPGTPSDLARLLVVDKGVYFDCDIYTLPGLPSSVTVPQGCFVNPNDVKYGPKGLNNDIETYASKKGRAILSTMKKGVIDNYFILGRLTPQEIINFYVLKDQNGRSLAEISGESLTVYYKDRFSAEERERLSSKEEVVSAVKNVLETRFVSVKAISNDAEKEDFLSRGVTFTAGPFALGNIFQSLDPSINFAHPDIIRYTEFLAVNVDAHFLQCMKRENSSTRLSWMPGFKRDYARDEALIDEFRVHLQSMAQAFIPKRSANDAALASASLASGSTSADVAPVAAASSSEKNPMPSLPASPHLNSEVISKIEKCFRTAYDKKLQKDKMAYCGMFSSLRISRITGDMSLEDIIKHAQKANNRSRSVCRELGWLNQDGNLAQGAPDTIKNIIELEKQPKIDEFTPLRPRP
ncbi:MAG: GTP-binding protein [Gammaproteobacteria bacterium]|nr:GTP-binding protein [Gammaproteobacteria bacterium]